MFLIASIIFTDVDVTDIEKDVFQHDIGKSF